MGVFFSSIFFLKPGPAVAGRFPFRKSVGVLYFLIETGRKSLGVYFSFFFLNARTDIHFSVIQFEVVEFSASRMYRVKDIVHKAQHDP